MKALILSFFVVILGYSLFFDTDKEPKLPVSTQDTTVQSAVVIQKPMSDTVFFYADKTPRPQLPQFFLTAPRLF